MVDGGVLVLTSSQTFLACSPSVVSGVRLLDDGGLPSVKLASSVSDNIMSQVSLLWQL